MLDAIAAEPGLHLREYTSRAFAGRYQAGARAAQRLAAAGLVRRTGHTQGVRYWLPDPN